MKNRKLTPLISIVIPVYNSESKVLICLDSIRSQSYDNYEVLIIDDGSTDDSYMVIENYISINSLDNFILLQQNNAGPSSARNLGIKYAKGDYISFLDSDDRWGRFKLENQINTLRKYPNIRLLGSTSKKIKANYKHVSFDSLLLKNRFVTSSTMVDSSIFESFRFDENLKYAEDYKLWCQIVFHYDAAIIYDPRAVEIISEGENKYMRNSLSSHILEMTKGGIANYKYLLETQRITTIKYFLLVFFAYIKLVRRFFIKYIK